MNPNPALFKVKEFEETFKLEHTSKAVCDAYFEKAKDVALTKGHVEPVLMMFAPERRFLLPIAGLVESPEQHSEIEKLVKSYVREHRVFALCAVSLAIVTVVQDKDRNRAEAVIVWAQFTGEKPHGRFATAGRDAASRKIHRLTETEIPADGQFSSLFKTLPVNGEYDVDTLYRGDGKWEG